MDNASAAEVRWNSNHAVHDYRRRFLLSNPHAQSLINKLYLGGADALGLLREELAAPPVPRALELAGGRGDFALAMIRRRVADRVHLVDLSPKAIAIAIEKGKAAGIDGLTAEVQDCNHISIKGTYPLIAFSQSLHHIERLEHVLADVHRALDEDGVFFVSDYIGPSRMQWTEEQLKLMNDFLLLIPEKLRVRCDPGDEGPGSIKKRVARLSIDTYLKSDPSEGVRSAEIESVIRTTFSSVKFFPTGGSITYELFRGIAHNFEEDETAVSLMKSIIIAEHALIGRGLPTNFGVFVCRK